MSKRTVFAHVRMFPVLLTLLVGMFAGILLAGCDPAGGETPEEIPFYPVVVYDDGVYAVECTGLTSEDTDSGSEIKTLILRITNNSTDCIALSSVLDISVSADGQPCQLLAVPPGKAPVDGLIDAGSSREGAVVLETPVGAKSFTVEIAVNHLEDQRISFTISR